MCKKKVSGTKMINFDNCERSEEMRRNESRGVYQRRIRHSSYRGVVISYDDRRGVEPCLKTSVHSHGMR
jgi:hypothetical protein